MKKYIVTEDQVKKIIDKLLTEEKELTNLRESKRIKKAKR